MITAIVLVLVLGSILYGLEKAAEWLGKFIEHSMNRRSDGAEQSLARRKEEV